MKLDLRLIIPGPTGATVLLDPSGALPAAQVEGDADEATVVAATAYLRDALAFATPIIETRVHPMNQRDEVWRDPVLGRSKRASDARNTQLVGSVGHSGPITGALRRSIVELVHLAHVNAGIALLMHETDQPAVGRAVRRGGAESSPASRARRTGRHRG